MKGAAVWIAPESPEEVPEPDADEPPEPEEPVVAVAASREAVEAAEPPAEMADWVASASSCIYISKGCYHREYRRSTYGAARGRCGGLAQEARVRGTASRVASSRAGGDTTAGAVGGHGHDTSTGGRATREVVGGSAGNFRAHAGVGSGEE
jgi:hypothetical protein